jgi:hypothetical protein
MPIYLMDKAYKIMSPGGVAANRVVVQGAVGGECLLPASDNAGGILGITVHSQASAGRSVSVRKAGIAEVAAGGPIVAGAPVIAAGSSGKVKAATGTPGTKLNCIGFAETPAHGDGDVIDVFLSIHERTL